MKSLRFKIILLLLLVYSIVSGRVVFHEPENVAKKNTNCFRENKGQVSDQFFNPRKDILFSGTDGKLSYFLKESGISYQLNRVDRKVNRKRDKFSSALTLEETFIEQFSIYRIDIEWLNINKSTKIDAEGTVDGYDNFYTESCPNGALYVKSYKAITYRNIYDKIDLKWYYSNGNLKYDYIVNPGGNYKLIEYKIKGAEIMHLNPNGDLVITTPFGELVEQAPVVIQNGKILKSKWYLYDDRVSFDIEGIDENQPFVIDPLIRLWSTYYGGALDDNAYNVSVDASNNIFLSGDTQSNTTLNIATVGSHQSTYGGPGTASFIIGDAYVAKFNSAGVRQWATYYGGTGSEFANWCAADINGNVYLTGGTTTTLSTVIATPGAHQTNNGGGVNYMGDAFLVKFNAAGVRQWGTYYGGTGDEAGYGVCIDAIGNVFMSGCTNSSNGNSIATAGSHQSVIGGGADAFLVKFDAAGNRMWATYYGGTSSLENGHACSADSNGDIYLMGYSDSPNGISTPGSHQTVFGGGGVPDGMLVKFNTNGVRQWGTYYGGALRDMFYAMKIVGTEIFISGETFSAAGTSIATPGSHQPVFGGGMCDAFLVKFDLAGTRIWGTYYGGVNNESALGVSMDSKGFVYVSGMTNTQGGTAIATPCSYQPNYGGFPTDLFLTKLTSNGTRLWGTYYGDLGYEYLGTCVNDGTDAIYLVGRTASNTGTVIASAGSHQTVFGGGMYDGFIVKFDGCIQVPPPNSTLPQNMTVCAGQSTSLSTASLCAINWYSSIGGPVISTNSAITTPTLTNNTTYYVQDATCGTDSLTAITITVNPLPVLQGMASNTVICSGSTVSLSVNGASTYTWLPSSLNTNTIIDNPQTTTVYTVLGSSLNCTNSFTIPITVVPSPSITLNYPSGPYCYGSTFTVQANGAQSYTWYPASSFSSATGSIVSTNSLSVSSTYTLLGENSNGISCLSQITFSSNVLPLILPTISPSVEICEGNNVVLTAGGGNTYFWVGANIDNPNQSTINASPLSSGIYSVSISNNYLCPVTASVFVKVNPKPFVFAGNDTTVNSIDEIFISAIGNGQFQWISGSNIACVHCSKTQVFPETSTCYVVAVMDTNGCIAQDEVCLNVINEEYIYIPNSFTPNNDGLNDVFYVYGIGIKNYSLAIYNRWGEKIFYSSNQTNGWDGKFKGILCEIGTYIYRLEYDKPSGEHKLREGHVNLISTN